MISQPSRFADGLFGVLGIILISWLSYSLVAAKKVYGKLQSDLVENTNVFAKPSHLPDMPIVLTGGLPTTLRGYCEADQALLFIFASPTCEACRMMEPEWATLREPTMPVRLILIRTEPISESQISQAGFDGFTDASLIYENFGIRKIPAAVFVDGACSVLAAGVGVESTRAILGLVSNQRSR